MAMTEGLRIQLIFGLMALPVLVLRYLAPSDRTPFELAAAELHDGGDDVDVPEHAHVPARPRVLPDGAQTQVQLRHLQERHARGAVPETLQPHRYERGDRLGLDGSQPQLMGGMQSLLRGG